MIKLYADFIAYAVRLPKANSDSIGNLCPRYDVISFTSRQKARVLTF